MLTLAQAQDPCSYTDGRWLHRDELQRKSRHIQFNFSRLCDIAVGLCDGATSVASYEKKEGGYNRVFVLTMDTGKRVVAKIPTSVAGPPRLATNSEVATMIYRTLSGTSSPQTSRGETDNSRLINGTSAIEIITIGA